MLPLQSGVSTRLLSNSLIHFSLLSGFRSFLSIAIMCIFYRRAGNRFKSRLRLAESNTSISGQAWLLLSIQTPQMMKQISIRGKWDLLKFSVILHIRVMEAKGARALRHFESRWVYLVYDDWSACCRSLVWARQPKFWPWWPAEVCRSFPWFRFNANNSDDVSL